MQIIDCDSHFLTCDIYKNIEGKYQQFLPKYIFDSENRVIDIQFNQDPCTFKDTEVYFTHYCDELGINNIDIRLTDLKKLKIDMQLLGPQERAMRFNYSVEKNLAAAMAHSYNVEIKKIVDKYPDKFFAVALVPLQDIDLALNEIKWIVANNFRGIYVDCGLYNAEQKYSGPLSSQSRMDEIFKICELNNLIIYQHHFMHKIKTVADNAMNIILDGQEINRVEISIYDWITNGTFDRFPKLQVLISEKSEKFIKCIFENLQNAYAKSKLKCQKNPLEYFKNNIFITVEVEKKNNVYYLIEKFGSDRLLFNTDYPHIDSAGLNKWNDVDDLYRLNLAQIDLENIAFRNAKKLFQLK
jgi:predicted TIM-barrel fold metal-dependent hydrolase